MRGVGIISALLACRGWIWLGRVAADRAAQLPAQPLALQQPQQLPTHPAYHFHPSSGLFPRPERKPPSGPSIRSLYRQCDECGKRAQPTLCHCSTLLTEHSSICATAPLSNPPHRSLLHHRLCLRSLAASPFCIFPFSLCISLHSLRSLAAFILSPLSLSCRFSHSHTLTGRCGCVLVSHSLPTSSKRITKFQSSKGATLRRKGRRGEEGMERANDTRGCADVTYVCAHSTGSATAVATSRRVVTALPAHPSSSAAEWQCAEARRCDSNLRPCCVCSPC